MRMKFYQSINRMSNGLVGLFCLVLVLLTTTVTQAQVVVESLAEFIPYTKESNVDVKIAPGTYTITAADVVNDLYEEQTIIGATNKVLLLFEGNNSTYDFTGVTIKIETAVLSAYGSTSVNELQIVGNHNVLKNLTMVDDGSVHDNPGRSACNIVMDGLGNLIEGFHMTIKGSFPYGYGDAFGKGAGPVIGHQKHSALLIRGESNRIKDCTLIHHSYGHAIFMQAASNPIIEGCYVEGEVRTTDDMLLEEGTGSPADNVDFMTVWGYRLPAGYMLSLAEAGIRAYNAGTTVIDGDIIERGTSNPVVRNCTVKNMRTGVTIAHATGTKFVENCTAIGCENGFSLASGDVINCRADAIYGPVYASTYENDKSFNADITVMPPSDDYYNGSGSVAYIGGSEHQLILRSDLDDYPDGMSIKVGGDKNNIRLLYGNLPHQNDFVANNIDIQNLTGFPINLSDKSSNVTGQSCGEINDLGTDNTIAQVPCDEICVELESFDLPTETKDGVGYKLYSGEHDEMPDFAAISATHVGQMVDLSISAADSLSQFALVLEGFLEAPSDDSYTFYIKSDDHAILKIDGQVVINHEGSSLQEVSAKVCLQAGSHLMQIQYLEKNSDKTFEVYYESSTIDKTDALALKVLDESQSPNLAFKRSASQSSTGYQGVASRAVDGSTDGVFLNNSVTHSIANTYYPWWQVDLGSTRTVGEIKIYNRTDSNADRLANFVVQVLTRSGELRFSQYIESLSEASLIVDAQGAEGDIVRVQIQGVGTLALAEVEVYEGAASSFGAIQMIKRSATLYAIDGGEDSEEDHEITLLRHSNHINLTWKEIDRGNGYYSYQQYDTDLCLYGGEENVVDQHVTLVKCAMEDVNQQWMKIGGGNDHFRLLKRGSELVIDGGMGRFDGANVFLGELDETSEDQQWKFEAADVGNLETNEKVLSTQNNELTQVIAYPNPVSGELTLTVPESKYSQLVIYNMDGRVIEKKTIDQNVNKLGVDVGSFNPGLYVLILSGRKTFKQIKVIKE